MTAETKTLAKVRPCKQCGRVAGRTLTKEIGDRMCMLTVQQMETYAYWLASTPGVVTKEDRLTKLDEILGRVTK